MGILLVGIMLIDTALKGTEKELAQQLQLDLIGAQGFLVWILAIAGIGAVGYIPGLQKTSRYMLALLAVVILLRNGGVFSQATVAIQQVSKAGPAPSIPQPGTGPSPGAAAAASSGGGGGGGGGGGSSDVDKGIKAAETAITIASIVAAI
jgi:hypothetical protein